jgi:hypothetical protein
VSRRRGIELLEERALDLDILDNRLDQQVRVADRLLGTVTRANVGETLGDEVLAFLWRRVLLLGDSVQVLENESRYEMRK